MFPTLKKISVVFAVVLTSLIALLMVLVQVRKERTFEAPFPDLHASNDPELIARGRYLVYGPAHCVDCHADSRTSKEQQGTATLTGGRLWDLPPGKFTAKNITPDPDTGIGRYSDAELARLLRYGVQPNGQAALPFMRYGNMTDDDLVAILSYLRSQKPVKRAVADSELNLLGDVAMAFIIEPAGPTAPLMKTRKPEATKEYGHYLAVEVAACVTCHTKMDPSTGALIAPPFSGGGEFPANSDPNLIFISPNLTPHAEDGWLKGWKEDAFVARMSAGPVHQESPMPWRAYQNLSEVDRRAIYRFLTSLPPSPRGPDPKTRDVMKRTGP